MSWPESARFGVEAGPWMRIPRFGAWMTVAIDDGLTAASGTARGRAVVVDPAMAVGFSAMSAGLRKGGEFGRASDGGAGVDSRLGSLVFPGLDAMQPRR